MIHIKISDDYTDNTGGRFEHQGSFSGERFRQVFLESLFNDNSDEIIQIDLDGSYGYAPSFLEEAFGGLVRLFGYENVSKRLKFISEENPSYIDKINKHMKDAKK